MEDLIIIEDEATPALPAVVGEQEIAACNYLAEGVRGHMQKAWQMAVALGYRLTLLKAKCEHGEWGKLFGVGNGTCMSHFNFTKRHADRYIQLFTACEARARQLEQSAGMLELLGYTTGTLGASDGSVDIQTKSEELSTMLTGMAPYAESMSQALFSFMYPEEVPEEAEEAQEFFKGGRNKKGRVRKDKELSAEAVVERKKGENFEALWDAMSNVKAELAAGRHLLLPGGARGKLIQMAQEILSKLMQTNGN